MRYTYSRVFAKSKTYLINKTLFTLCCSFFVRFVNIFIKPRDWFDSTYPIVLRLAIKIYNAKFITLFKIII